jgi:hypothetical protein
MLASNFAPSGDQFVKAGTASARQGYATRVRFASSRLREEKFPPWTTGTGVRPCFLTQALQAQETDGPNWSFGGPRPFLLACCFQRLLEAAWALDQALYFSNGQFGVPARLAATCVTALDAVAVKHSEVFVAVIPAGEFAHFVVCFGSVRRVINDAFVLCRGLFESQ